MTKSKKSLRNLSGSRDWLPEEVAKQEFVKNKLVKLFELWGYKPIQTPIIINSDNLTLGSPKLSDVAFKLIGQHGEVLALRADLTTPIARVTAERLKGEKLPFRFYYVGKVFRYHARKTTNERELYQIGVELIGKKEGLSDLECLKIFSDSLNKLGFKDYLILINHTSLWKELFRCFGNLAEELYKALSKKDMILFNSILSKSRFSKKEKTFWNELIKIKGGKETLKQIKALSKLSGKFKAEKIINYFKKVFEILDKNVEIDLSFTSDLDYYTGIYFEAISSYIGRSVGSGGRYDGLLSKFGYDVPAIGFTFCLEDLLLVLEKQNKTFPEIKESKSYLTIAIPKGFLHDNSYKYLSKLGINFDSGDSRELIFFDKKNKIKGILVRPNDVGVYVEHGSADLGIVGLDLLKEQVPDAVKLKDLKFGKCKLVLAVKKDSGYKRSKDLPANCKIATKFTKLSHDFIHTNGLSAEVIKLYGSVELAPLKGLSEAIIDLVATGKTLKANNLVAIETILESSAILIANPVSYKLKRKRINELINKVP